MSTKTIKIIDWDKFLEDKHTELISKGYKKYYQAHKRSDFQYFKSVDGQYQIGIYVYDFRKCSMDYPRVSLSYECILNCEDHRIDMSVSKDIEIEEFEEMCAYFNEAMQPYK